MEVAAAAVNRRLLITEKSGNLRGSLLRFADCVAESGVSGFVRLACLIYPLFVLLILLCSYFRSFLVSFSWSYRFFFFKFIFYFDSVPFQKIFFMNRAICD